MNKKKYISFAKKAANIQISELKKIKKVFNNSFVKAINLISNTKGKIIFCGVGKNSFICKKSAATFSSVGIPSFFIDPVGASHGDMGLIEKKDILIIISNSGNTYELSNIINFANRFRIKIIGIASNPKSIVKSEDIKILVDERVWSKQYSPNIYLFAMLSWFSYYNNDEKEIFKENFRLYHKGGALGETLKLAKDIMVTGKKMPIISHKKFTRGIKIMNQKKLGIVVILKNKYIKGLVTTGI